MSLGTSTVGRLVGAAGVALAAGLVVAEAAVAASDIGRNVGQEVASWGKWLLLATAALVALPAMARRDLAGLLVIAGMVVIAGGFVFAPEAVERTIVSLWRSFGGGR